MAYRTKTRMTLDDKGRPVREVADELGRFEPLVDTREVRTLGGDKLNLAEPKSTRPPDFNPYQGSSVGKAIKQRSRLDYMRALSEEIKRRAKVTKK